MIFSRFIKMAGLSLVVVVAMLTIASCGGRRSQKQSEKVSSDMLTDEEMVDALQLELKIRIDSLSSCISRLGDIPLFAEGALTLSDQEKLVKPTYLLDFETYRNLVTWRQKYRAVAMYNLDMQIAQLYGMSVKQYQKILYKLYVDIDNPVMLQMCAPTGDTLVNLQQSNEEFMNALYDEEADKGTLNLYWEAVAGGLVETTYLLTMNTDKYLTAFDDKSVSELCERYQITYLAVTDLMEYYPEMEEIQKAITPLAKIKAKDVKSFASELKKINKELSAIRNSFLGI